MFKSKDRKTELDLIMAKEENQRITQITEALKKRLTEMESTNNEEKEQLKQTIEKLKTRIIDLEKNEYVDEIRTLESKLITCVFERIEINKLLSEMEKIDLNASISSERKYYEVYRVFSDYINTSNSKIKKKLKNII